MNRLIWSKILAVILLLAISCSAAAVEVFPLDEVRPGLQGIGRTVVQGTSIEEFQAEVISIIPQTPPTPSLIMVRVSGTPIERSGGIAAGMSGSPVYVNGKLLGAIGYGYANSDHRIGLVTPAEAMLEVMEQVEPNLTDSTLEPPKEELPDGFAPLRTPLLLSGFSGRASEMLTEQLSTYDVQVVAQAAGQDASLMAEELAPGSAFGVQLLRGDFQAVSFGTVTHVEPDGRLVGFGHPFLHKGPVNFFLTPAQVHYTVSSSEFPFKVASAGQTIGSITQDRAAGVSGRIGDHPEYVPIEIRVEDQDRGLKKEFQVEAVRDESLLTALAVSSAYQGIDATLDRIGRGTAYVRLDIAAKNLPNGVVRENMFYDDSDIAVWALFDLIEGLELLLRNEHQAVDLSEIGVEVSIGAKRQTALIEQAIPRSFTVPAGGSVEVEVIIRPYRGETESRVLRLDIPEDTVPGTITVTVRPGGTGYYTSKPDVYTTFGDESDEEEEDKRQRPSGGETLDKLIEDFVERERNNEIVAEFYPFVDNYPYPEEAQPSAEADVEVEDVEEILPESSSSEEGAPAFAYHWDEQSSDPVRVRLTTQHVIEGMATFDIEVLESNR